MKILRHWTWPGFADRPSVVTLGNFDGVHRGHREIIRRAVEGARAHASTAVAVTFEPHPLGVLAPERAPRMLGTVRQRVALLAECGIEVVVLQHFTRRFSSIGAEEFVREYLVEKLRVRHVVVGHNVGFGHHRQGNADFLRRLGARYGFEVEVVPPVTVEGRRVSSSAIRSAVREGKLREAGAMLGRPYSICSRVIRGRRRGKQLGFPTANLRIGGVQLPPDGVYAVRATVGERTWPGVANLGFNPTFGNEERSLEVHLFGFEGELYGQRLEVAFLERLREERKFPGPAELADQIRLDIERARQILGVE